MAKKSDNSGCGCGSIILVSVTVVCLYLVDGTNGLIAAGITTLAILAIIALCCLIVWLSPFIERRKAAKIFRVSKENKKAKPSQVVKENKLHACNSRTYNQNRHIQEPQIHETHSQTQSALEFCENCGAQVNDCWFCTRCGHPTTPLAAQWKQMQQQDEKEEPTQKFVEQSQACQTVSIEAYVRKELAKIDSMDGLEFERYCARLLSMFGFSNVQVTQASGDFGVDIIANDNTTTWAVQCKRYCGTLGAKPIQEVYAGMRHYGANKALVITNNYFSDNAKRLAEETGVTLWNRDCVAYVIKKYLTSNRISTSKTDPSFRPRRECIPYVEGTKEYIRMYITEENLECVYLTSETFETFEEAEHFSRCFNDCFGTDAFTEGHDGKFCVYSNWIERYKINSNFHPTENAFIFANWS